MSHYVVTGAASGIGAATRDRLLAAGETVIGIDLGGSDVDADLSTGAGRAAAVAAVLEQTDTIDGVVTCAGIAGLPGRAGEAVTAVNYFGSVEILNGLRPALARSDRAAAVAISSNSVTTVPLVDDDLVEACLAGDEAAALGHGERLGPFWAYPSSKAAIWRWVRRTAPTDDWAGAGITLNAIAPGVTETAMITETRADPMVREAFDQIPIPAGRSADADEMAAVIELLLGPSGRYFCGSVLMVDGGTDALMNADKI